MLRRHLLLGAGIALAAPSIARAQAARPLRIVVPFVPGGAIDLIGRLLAERLPAYLGGQTAVVDNRAGAGGMIGAENVARSTPDGTTLGVIGVSALCAFPTLYDRVPYDPMRDFTPVTQITSGVQLCVVKAETARRYGVASLDEARAYLAHPVLGPRLRECAGLVAALEGRSARDVFGAPDDLKLRSSMTLFAEAAGPGDAAAFGDVLERFFHGAPDPLTLAALGRPRPPA